MLDGKLLTEAGDERRVAAAGHVAVLPGDQMHTCLVVSPTALYLTLHTPAGFDGFVRDVSGADGMPPYRAALIALPAEHGIDIVGPHCSPLASESPRARYYGGGDCALGGRGRQYRRSGDGDGGGAQGTLPG